MHLDETAKAHGVVLMDRAGWHSDQLNPHHRSSLPSRSPELNPVENIWPIPPPELLSNRVFEDYDEEALEQTSGYPSVDRLRLLNRNGRRTHIAGASRVATGWRIIPACRRN